MTIVTQRAILLALSAPGAAIGLWAQFWPMAFYDSFPSFGRQWISVDGPYSEHLVRDVGAAYLALTVLSLLAVHTPLPALVRATGAAWLTFGALHLAYHSTNLGVYDTTDAVLNTAGLAASVLLAAALLWPARAVTEA